MKKVFEAKIELPVKFYQVIRLFLLIIVLGGGTFTFYELNKTDKIDTQEELSPVEKHAQTISSTETVPLGTIYPDGTVTEE